MNNTLLRLVQQAKERIKVEKAQASKSGAPAPIRNSPTASARAFHQGSVKPVPAGRPDVFEDSSPFAVDDNQRDSLQAETFDCEKDGDGQCEASSTDDVNIQRQDNNTKRAFVKHEIVNVSSPNRKRHKPSRSLEQRLPVNSCILPVESGRDAIPRREISATLLSRLLVACGNVKQVQDNIFALRLDASPKHCAVYMTSERGSERHRYNK